LCINMNTISVKIDGNKVEISKPSFVNLLDYPLIKELKIYKEALHNSEVSFPNLKDLANRACVPYPLFFAPENIINEQIRRKDKLVYQKLPSKNEISIASRGTLNISDIELIARDLGRKQEFIKRRVLVDSVINPFVGIACTGKKINKSIVFTAKHIREYLDLDLCIFRSKSKKEALTYLCRLAEKINIFIAFSSRDFMPQNLRREVLFSGMCIKDSRFPFVFINRRELDDNPVILESEGRQIFTIMCMLVCISLNKFVFSIKDMKKTDDSFKNIFLIAGEIIVPKSDLVGLRIDSIDKLKDLAKKFKVTPSLLLMRLIDLGQISKTTSDMYFNVLKRARIGKKEGGRRPNTVDGYIKYNGERFSKEVSSAYLSKKVTYLDISSLLFRQSKASKKLVHDYVSRFN